MALTERLALLVTLDAQGAVKGFNDLGKAADRNLAKADSRIDRVATGFQKAGAGMLAGAGLAAAGLYKAGQAAADLEQAVGGTSAVFGDTSGKIDEFAKKAASAIGLSEREFREATTSIGGQLKGLGFTVEEAADQAVNLSQVAADLSATYGGTTAEAVAALGAAFRGEADPAERFNLFLNQTRVNAKAVELGLAATTSEVSANAKAQATLALITEQSADALGQFGREADTAAGAQARMKAELENAVAAIGQGVAPIIGDLATGVGGLAAKFNELPGPVQNTVSKVATYGTIATAALGATSLLAGKVLEGRDRFRQLGAELPRTSRAMKGLGAAIGTLGGLAAIDSLDPLSFLNKSLPDIQEMENALTRLAQGRAVESLGLDFESLGRSVERITDPSVATRISNFAAEASTLGGLVDFGKDSDLDSARKEIDALDQSLASLATRDPGLAADALNTVAEELGINVRDLVPLLDSYESTLAGVDTEQRVAAESMGQMGERARFVGGDIASVRTQFDELTESLRASIDADFAYEDSISDTADALRRLGEEGPRAVADARDALNRAKQDLAAAHRATVDPDLEGQERADAQARIARDIEDRERAVRDAATSLQEAERRIADATRDARDALIEQADAAVAVAEQNAALAGKTLDASDRQQIFRDNLAYLAADLKGPVREALDETIERMDNLAAYRKAHIDIEIRESRLAITAGKLSGPDGGRRAIGGPVTAGGRYSVNEYLGAGKGFEWFAPANGTVHPGPSAAPTSQNISITINNPVPEPVSTQLRRARGEAALMAG